MNFHNFKSPIKNVNVINVNFDNLTNNMILRKTIESYNTRLTRGYEVGRFQRVKDVAAPVSHQNVSDDGVKLLLVFG